MATKTWTINKDAALLLAGSTGLAAGADDHLPVGVNGSNYMRSLLQFNLDWSGVVQITSAVLWVYTSGTHLTYSSSFNIKAFRNTAAWTENSGRSGYDSPGGGGFSTSPTVYPGPSVADDGCGAFTGNGTPGSWKSYVITPIANMWAPSSVKKSDGNPGGNAANYGIALRQNGEWSTARNVEFKSHNSGTNPYIVLTYSTNAAPYAPTLNSPVGGALVTSQTPTLNFTPTDPDGDTMTAYYYQIDDGPDFASVFEAGEIAGSYPSGVAVNRVVTTTLVRGGTYYWRVQSRDATNGYGPYSSTGSFYVGQLPTVSVGYPSNGMVAKLYYYPASATTPKFYVGWTFSCPDGHAQASAIVRVKNDALSVEHTHNVSGGVTAVDISGYAPSNLSYHRITVQVTCTAGLQSTETTDSNRTRACWSRASYYYNMGATPPVGWGTPVVNATGSVNVIEWSASTSTSEPSTWYAALADVPLPSGAANYVWHRVTQFSQANTASPTKPTVQDVTPKWVTVALTADNWTYGTTFTVDPSDQKYGTQSLKGTCGASATTAYQVVPVQPNTVYVLSGYIKSLGNSGSLLRIEEADGSGTIVTGAEIVATQEFTRQSLAAFNSGSRTSVRVVCRIGTTTGAAAWFDALKLEASPVVTPWTPGFIGQGVAIDAGGVQIDGAAAGGGVLRLRAGAGGARDQVILDGGGSGHGLLFGDPTTDPASLYSPAADVLATDGVLRSDDMAPQHIDDGGGSHNVTVTTHGTYYYTGLEKAFTPQWVGQRYLILFTAAAEMTAGNAQYVLLRIDITDNSDTQVALLGYARAELSGVAGKAPGVAFNGYWAADAIAIRKVRVYVTLQTDDGKTVYVNYGQVTVVPVL